MNQTSQDICRVLESIIDGMFGLSADQHDLDEISMPDFVASRVIFLGEEQGIRQVLVLRAATGLARKLAATMFGIELAEVTDEDVNDVVGELTNIAGGNLRSNALMDSRLSTPERLEPADFLTHISEFQTIEMGRLMVDDQLFEAHLLAG